VPRGGVTVKGRKRGIVKAVGLFGLLLLLSLLGYSKIASAPTEAARGSDRPVTLPAPVATERRGVLPAGFSVHVFLHQTRHEDIPVHAMAVMRACPE
jgi:hypothetical protein